ncbi:MAG: DNA-binding response regulator [Kordiimonadales bacterium]|nr:MAG: DNA-binding response regulator [Kordiimonadales bacterium]
MNILIVEDEAIAADQLQNLLKKVAPEATVCAVTDSIESTVSWLHTNDMPDLLLMDINLADGSCFSVFDVIDITAPIVFCTAYDEYALKAFQSNGIAYLLKPILESDLRGALDKLATLTEALQENGDDNRRVLKSIGGTSTGYKSRFLIKTGEKLLPVPTSDISCFMAQDQGVKLYMSSGDNYFLDYTVTELEHLLNPEHFFRISRQTIIAGDKIVSASANMRNARVILDCMPTEIAVARERTRAFRRWFDS